MFFSFLPPGSQNGGLGGPMRRRITDKSPVSMPAGMLEKLSMPPGMVHSLH